MGRRRFSAQQIVEILREGESGLPIVEVCEQYDCSVTSFYRWKAKFSGLDVSEVKRLIGENNEPSWSYLELGWGYRKSGH